MIFRKYTYHILLFIIFFVVPDCLSAQAAEIKTDKNQILIGERIQYDLSVTLPSLEGVSMKAEFPDSLLHFEIIEKSGADTSNTNGSISVHRKFIFTSFDSGSWYIPSLPVTIGINKVSKTYMTDSVLINVGYAAADTTGNLRDIKPIMEVEIKDYFWYYVVGAILTVIILFLVLYDYIKKRNRKPLPVLHSALSAYDEAMHDLNALSKYDLSNSEEVKEYHSQLSFILKRYYSRVTENNLLNKTTGGLLLQMKQQEVDSVSINSIAGFLRIGDAVKFAKHIPAVAESEKCAADLKLVIDKLDKDKPFKSL
jgi:hypothetical protein